MKASKNFYISFLLLLFISSCSQRQTCLIKEWKVIDVYRNSYKPFIDTICDDKIPLVNESLVDRSLIDSIFKYIDNHKVFSLDNKGSYLVKNRETIEFNGANYDIAKVQYLGNGQNVDQEFLLYVVKGKGIYIQQESHDRKLYLLKSIRYNNGKVENVSDISDKILKDTFLFPLPPKP